MTGPACDGKSWNKSMTAKDSSEAFLHSNRWAPNDSTTIVKNTERIQSLYQISAICFSAIETSSLSVPFQPLRRRQLHDPNWSVLRAWLLRFVSYTRPASTNFVRYKSRRFAAHGRHNNQDFFFSPIDFVFVGTREVLVSYRMYHYPNLLRRLGAVPGLVRLLALAVETITLVLLVLRHQMDHSYTTSYIIVSSSLTVNLR